MPSVNDEKEAEGTVTVLTFNLLATSMHSFISVEDPSHLLWSNRLPLILNEIDKFPNALLCFQEVSRTMAINGLTEAIASRGYTIFDAHYHELVSRNDNVRIECPNIHHRRIHPKGHQDRPIGRS